MKNKFECQILIDKIETLCMQYGISANKLGLESGLGKSVVDNMKKGSMPSVDKVYVIADYFDCSVDYLLGREQKNLSSELSDNEKRIIDIFKSLEPIQQGEIIGRAQLMAEQNKQRTETATRRVYVAARSSDNHESQIVDMPVEKLQRLREAPETDNEDL